MQSLWRQSDDDVVPGFSLDGGMLRTILEHAKPLGHNEDVETLNLGFGFLYYGLVRCLRPNHIVVIGSGFGFSVVCLALGARDNGNGRISFVDPSYSLLKNGPFSTIGGTGKWDDPAQVDEHLRRFGVAHLTMHYRQTSAEFFREYQPRKLPEIDLAFIDGNHAYKHAKNDFLGVIEHAHRNSYVLLHDTNIYIRELLRHSGVKRWLKVLKREKQWFEVIDFPFASGVALVRVLQDKLWKDTSWA